MEHLPEGKIVSGHSVVTKPWDEAPIENSAEESFLVITGVKAAVMREIA